MFEGEDMSKLREELLRSISADKRYLKVSIDKLNNLDDDGATPIQRMEKAIADNLPQYKNTRLKRRNTK